MIESIRWQSTCCAWHGEYAEHPANDGGTLRLKRGPLVDGFLVMRFDSTGACKTVDADGVPVYENINEATLLELI